LNAVTESAADNESRATSANTRTTRERAARKLAEKPSQVATGFRP